MEGEDEATRAFQDLTAEVRVLRQAVERLERKEPPDYSATLSDVMAGQEALYGGLQKVFQAPGVRMAPDEYAHRIHAGVEHAAKAATSELQRAQGRAEGLVAQLTRAKGVVRTRAEQRTWVIYAAAIGFVIGVFLTVFGGPALLRATPDSWRLPEKHAAAVLAL